MLRQLPQSKTVITKEAVQPIVPWGSWLRSSAGRAGPSGGYQAESLPWNRHIRRMRKAWEVVVHFFSGDGKTWNELGSEDREVLCVDLALHRCHDLLSDQASDLMELCGTGTLQVLHAARYQDCDTARTSLEKERGSGAL